MTDSQQEYRIQAEDRAAEIDRQEPPPDPMLIFMEQEFAKIGVELVDAGVDDEDRRAVISYAKYLKSRLDEIAQIEDYAARRTGIIQREIDRAQDWRASKAAEALARITAGQKVKSLDTPFGRVGFRTTSKPSVSFDPHDEEDLRIWCSTYVPGALIERPAPAASISKAVLAEFLTSDNAPVCPLVHVEPAGQQRFHFAPAKPGKEIE